MILLDDCPARHFMVEYGASLERPDAILMISAHWETHDVAVATTPTPPTIHDFYGFPEPFYRFHYQTPGAPEVAARAADCLKQAGMKVFNDPQRGLDHGAWVPLVYMFPDADIPVAQVSIQCHLGPRHHLELGKALAPLRDENILLLASGNTTHGRRAGHVEGPVLDWVAEFSEWVHGAVMEGRVDDLVGYRSLAPYAKENHPTDDHYVPLLIAMGAGGEEAKVERLHASYTYRTISMDSYAFH
jgi:4,5-DOPA dioxygenase extradiol